MLTNHIHTDHYTVERSLHRRQLRAAGRLTYCLFDFDLAMMLPAGMPLSAYRLPIDESVPGVPYKPWGVDEAQLDFDPFAFDVACLGISFCQNFQLL